MCLFPLPAKEVLENCLLKMWALQSRFIGQRWEGWKFLLTANSLLGPFCKEHEFFVHLRHPSEHKREIKLWRKVVILIPLGSVSETVPTVNWACSLPFTGPFTLAFQWRSVMLNHSARLTSSAFPWLGEKEAKPISKCHLPVALKWSIC